MNRTKGNVISTSKKNELYENLNEVRLTFYFQGHEPKDTCEILDIIEKKVKKKLNIKLDFKFVPRNGKDYIKQIKDILSSEEPCDAFFYSRFFAEDLKTLVDGGLIKDLTDIFRQYAPNYFKKYTKEDMLDASVQNKIYAIPYFTLAAHRRCAIVREDMIQKYQISDITTYDDYEKYLDIINKREPHMIPMTFSEPSIYLFAEAYGYVVLDYQLGIVYKWDDPEMKVYVWEETPEFKNGIETINRWYKKGYFAKVPYMAKIDMASITSGKWGSFIAASGSEIYYNSFLKRRNIDWTYESFFLYPEKQSQRHSLMNSSLVISEKSKYSERILMFLEWLYSEQENYDLLMYGIKGKHYELEKGRIILPEENNAAESFYSWRWRPPFINLEYERLGLYESEVVLKDFYKIVREKSEYPPHSGFVLDFKTIESIVNKRKIIYKTTEGSIYNNTFAIEDIDGYVKDIKNQGIDVLLIEIQGQIYKWKEERKNCG